ncbi:MAG TPA: RNA polymerase sigma factor [Candidatus Polarisedimenticolaceae bacterium]|nr:RNA polymerase sigma factor [Candidatus Polarisedimenticolaceae bacterium]
MDKHTFMRACREGGEAIEGALRALDRSLYAPLYRDSVRTLRDPEAARDVVQETFIKVWQRCATFHGESELLPWVRAILRHAMLDRLRRPEREVAMADDAEPEARSTAAAARPLSAPESELRRRQLGECFQRCWKRFEAAAPAHAAVLSWIVEDDLSNEEISALLGRTPGATREFISQCRKRARLHLAEWYDQAVGAR